MSKRKQNSAVTTNAKSMLPAETAADNYDSKEYWNNRYESSNGHEWYYSFDLLLPLFEKSLKADFNGTILELGCGDKPLVPGFATSFPNSHSIVGIDYSQNVVDLLNKSKHADAIKYQQMDARRTNFISNSIDFIVDKGTMDAMLSASSVEQGFANVSKIFLEMVRIMKLDSTFVIVSHVEADSEEFHELMQNVILPALDTKRTVLWNIEAHEVSRKKSNRCDAESDEDEEDEKATNKRRKADTISNNKQQKASANKGDDGEEDAEDLQSGGHGTVYIITSKTRKYTRNMLTSGAPVGFKVLSYDSDSDEGDDDEDDEEEK